MHSTPPGIFLLWGILLAVFVGVPAKFLYDNAAALRPLARVLFALTAPAIFIVSMLGVFAGISSLFDTSANNYRMVAATIIALSVAALGVLILYRLLKRIAGRAGIEFGRPAAGNASTHRSIDPASLKRPLLALDLSFYSLVAVSIYLGLAHESRYAPPVGAAFLLMYLIALGTLASRLKDSWITWVGASLLSGGVGLIVLFVIVRRQVGKLIRTAGSRAVSIS